MEREITFEIKRHIANLGTTKSGRTKELNFVSWNGNEPKYDIRDWDADHQKMGKGITLTLDEMNELAKYFVSASAKKSAAKSKKAAATA